jgi:hypothetical protein
MFKQTKLWRWLFDPYYSIGTRDTLPIALLRGRR